MSGPFVFMDLRTADADRSRSFFPQASVTVIEDPVGAALALWPANVVAEPA
jgi:hypothetical protein